MTSREPHSEACSTPTNGTVAVSRRTGAQALGRRQFLRCSAGAAIAAVWGNGATLAADAQGEQREHLPRLTHPPATQPVAAPSLVADVRTDLVLDGPQIHAKALLGMIDRCVQLATRHTRSTEAWSSLLKPDDVVGIKFDPVGAESLATTEVFAEQLVSLIERAAIPRERIVLIDAPAGLDRTLKTQPRVYGWLDQESAFGTGAERLAAVIEQVTAVVNVAFLKTDNLTGISGALKNISVPFLRRQLPYLRDGGVPSIPQIIALPAIRTKLRIHMVNALRAVFDRGPDVHPDFVWELGGVLASVDPVALDQVGTDLLNERRDEAELPAIGNRDGHVSHVQAAAAAGLGTNDQDYIRILRPETD